MPKLLHINLLNLNLADFKSRFNSSARIAWLAFVVFIASSIGSRDLLANQTTIASSVNAINIDLSNAAQEAINNGVSLVFNCELARLQSYWFFSIAKKHSQYKFSIVRHSLSNRYIVTHNDTQTPHIFRSISQAMNYLTAQSAILLERYANQDNHLSIRLSLDKYNLPGPMRLNAFISDDWNLNTGWIAWQSAN